MNLLGDPVADVFAVCARPNSCVLALADGVNWGEKSRLAARCAIRGAVDHLSDALYDKEKPVSTTSVSAVDCGVYDGRYLESERHTSIIDTTISGRVSLSTSRFSRRTSAHPARRRFSDHSLRRDRMSAKGRSAMGCVLLQRWRLASIRLQREVRRSRSDLR